jgi:23S rRNA pseudouridine2605 synthase
VERLQKYLASCGVASRRKAEQLISAGRVVVNGQVVSQLGAQVEPGVDRVEVDGRSVEPATAKLYLMVNKPTGVVTTTSDPWGRKTVLDLVPKLGRVFPVGRLDADSEGLLLLTNDGELANRLMHPRYGCEKEYHVLVRGEPTPEALRRLREGIDLVEGRTAPAVVEIDRPAPGGGRWLRVILHEGRKRQVRRMLAEVGLPVEQLRRVRIGPLELEDLPPGRARPLSRSEVAALRQACWSES